MHIHENKKIFYHLLGNSLVALVTNMFVWFCLTYWAYLETKSVIITSLVAGMFAILNMLGAFFFGNIVDHNKKRVAMVYSSVASLVAYSLGALLFFTTDAREFTEAGNPVLWLLIFVLMVGCVAGNLRIIALATLVTGLFEPQERDKANGLVGGVQGIGFVLTSVLSGLAIGFLGMDIALVCALVTTILTLIHLGVISFEEPPVAEHEEGVSKHFDFKGTKKVVSEIDGLFMLILFTTFNNFLGGVFMALMDAYGLSLMSVQAWGILWGVLSLSLLVGSAYIAKMGLGSMPLRKLLFINVITWTTCIFFTVQSSIILLAIGILIWMTLGPFVESIEHTIMQAVVPFERQGRVMGFAQSIESMAMPVTAFYIGPVAQFVFIPYMTDGVGAELIGSWFGTGPDRGIALLFSFSGLVGLVVTLLAFKTRAYHILSKQYQEMYERNEVKSLQEKVV
jgi:DHA3 family multidrug efflux protein-like MFS transporter